MRTLCLRKNLIRIALASVSIFACNTSFAAAVANEVTLNDYHSGNQVLVATAAAGNGNKFTLWSDTTRGNACFVQVVDNQGTRLFNTEISTGFQCQDIAADRIGNFIVTTSESDGSGKGVYARMYDRFGNARANPIRVNDVITNDQYGGVINIAMDGKFAVGWGQRNSSNNLELFVKLFNANGQALTGQNLVANNSVNQSIEDIVIQTNGNIAVIFSAMLNNDFDVWLRRFYPTGTATGPAVRVNTYQSSLQVYPKLVSDAQGSMLATWDSYRQDGEGWSCYGQFLDSSANKVGSPFRLTSLLSTYESACEVGMADDRSFVAVWQHIVATPSYKVEIHSREFSPSAQPISEEIITTAKAGEDISVPRIAVDGVGNYSLAWRANGATNGYEVVTQRFKLNNQASITNLSNNSAINNLQATTGSWIYYKINIPANTSTLAINTVGGGNGNADVYINYGSLPTLTKSDIKLTNPNSSEAANISTPPVGDMYIGLYAKEGFSGTQLNVYYY